MTDFFTFLILGLTLGSTYALIALGYTLVYGVLQLINFAHSEVFMTGAFGSYLVVRLLVSDNNDTPTWQIPFVMIIGVLAGAVTAGAIAWLLERVAYRPLRKRGAPKLAFLISAIGASFFLATFVSKVFNNQTANRFPQFFNPNYELFTIDGAPVKLIQVIMIGTAIVMMFFLDRLVNVTKLGRSIRAVSEDAPTAALMGINIDKTISRTFIIGGLLGGIAGFLYGLNLNFGYNMGFIPGVKAFAAAVLGGIGNIRGAMLGGLLLGVVENLFNLIPGFNTAWTDAIAFLVLVLVLMFRPTGILGERVGRAA